MVASRLEDCLHLGNLDKSRENIDCNVDVAFDVENFVHDHG